MDPIDSFKKYLTENFSISETTWALIHPLLKEKRINKNTFIVEENQTYSKELFLVSGIVRLFYLDSDGNEINIAFYRGIEILPPYFTRNLNGKHSCHIEALSDVVLVEFEAESFSKLIRSNAEVQHFATQAVEKELRYKVEREKLYLSQNAQTRLADFRSRYKGLENEIPHYHIASYLGISPVSLSRLRKDS